MRRCVGVWAVCLALPQRADVAPISLWSPGHDQGLSGHHSEVEEKVDLRLRGLGVKLCCFTAVQQRDKAGVQGTILILPL